MKACTQPHALLHSLTGIGLGLILVALVPSLVANALMFGVVVVVVGVVGEMMVKK
ncbi:MAG: hypothetical protein Q7S45_02195 [Candidatus Curtissbacteria bacterium]|nr:hypothetical protein [Candidatus Curtissbacteria bacterium]